MKRRSRKVKSTVPWHSRFSELEAVALRATVTGFFLLGLFQVLRQLWKLL